MKNGTVEYVENYSALVLRLEVGRLSGVLLIDAASRRKQVLEKREVKLLFNTTK